MSDCPSCGAGLETPLVCHGCGVLFSPDIEPDPFASLGLPVAFPLDPKLLKKRLLSTSRLVHPDFFGSAPPETQALAERNAARLNAAYETLGDDFRRADHLVRVLNGPSEKDERQMPQAFLMEVLEWNETLEEARDAAPGSPERAALTALESDLTRERADALEQIGAHLDPLPPAGAPALTQTRQRLNAIRYIDRTLREIKELRLEEAAS